MPRHIQHSGLDAKAARMNGARVYLIRDRDTKLGIAREVARNDWCFWRSAEAMSHGDRRCYADARKLEDLMEQLAQGLAAQERIVTLNVKDRTMTKPFTFQQVIREIDNLVESCREGSLDDKEAVCEAIAEFTLDYPQAENYAGKKLVEMFLPEFKVERCADLEITELAAA